MKNPAWLDEALDRLGDRMIAGQMTEDEAIAALTEDILNHPAFTEEVVREEIGILLDDYLLPPLVVTDAAPVRRERAT